MWQNSKYTGKFPCSEEASKETLELKIDAVVEDTQVKRSGGLLCPLLVGFLFMAFAVIIITFNPLDLLVKWTLAFGPDTLVFNMWRNPPAKVSLNFYIFNYTNSQEFLSGDEKLAMQQIGPYSYQEITEYKNVTFNQNRTMSYVPIRSAIFDPALTVGDPFKDIVVVPNFAFLGLASYLSDSSYLTNMAFNFFSRMVKSEPFLTMTVDEYLTGYNEPLLSYANKLIPGFVTFGKMGYLDRIVNEGDNLVTVSLNDRVEELDNGVVYQPFTVDNINGDPGLKEFGYDPDDNVTHRLCNTLQGKAVEGTLIPRRMQEADVILFYRKGLCRILPIVFDRPGKTRFGVPAYWLKMPEDNFHNSNQDNSCYCDRDEGECLPEGLTDISACLFGMPIAMSAPHFLYGDPQLVESWNGLSPDPDQHGSYGQVDNVRESSSPSHI